MAEKVYITDYISGERVKAGPEEVEAVQIFSRRLVEEYNYDKAQICTRPQFRIRESPSGKEKYPVDIAVFHDENQTYDNLFMVVECKRRTKRTGVTQLKLYMGLSAAQIGVWFNGREHVYLQKILDELGNVTYRELPNIPRKFQRVEDIGHFRRRDLSLPTNLKAVFRDIRNHLAGMTTGITRDETLAQQMINLLFCKLYDEINTPLDKIVTFRAGAGETPQAVQSRIVRLFKHQVKQEYDDVFDTTDTLTLDPDSLVYVVGELQNYLIHEADRDAIGEAFEVFIGPALRGSEGQFFTPRNVVKMMIDILDPSPGEMLIDPACGSGGFLIAAIEHVWRKLDAEAQAKGWSAELLGSRKREIATRYFRGIDKDAFLSKVTKAYMAIIGDGRGGVFCENSLRPPDEWSARVRDKIPLESFDVLLTNPPFGSKISVRGAPILGQYDLARRWSKDKATGAWNQQTMLRERQSPQVLFIERCLQLLKPGGRMGIILPESLFGNPSHEYIVQWLRGQAHFLGLVSMPEELFQPYTHAKTCVVFLEKTPPAEDEDYRMYMGIVRWCGHDSRGHRIPHDDVPRISHSYARIVSGDAYTDRLGFRKRLLEVKSNILVPKYYDPDIDATLDALRETHDLTTIGALVDQDVLSITTGDEVGKLSYGTGQIPFIRTSDIANWELKIDPKHGLSEEIYEKYRQRQDVRARDILMVRDGTYLVGTTCMLTEADTCIVFQSHLYKLRVLKPDVLSPYLLLVLLNSPIVKRQVWAKRFTQDIIDTLGRRVMELVLPIPRDSDLREHITTETRTIVEGRAELRQKARTVSSAVMGHVQIEENEETE
jgi:type I restriction enzyme M protein